MSLAHTTNDPADLLSDDARAWLAGTMAKNTARFGGWSMEADTGSGDGDNGGTDGDDDSSDDDGSQGSDDADKGGDKDTGDGDEDAAKKKFNKESQRYREQARTAQADADKLKAQLAAITKAISGDKGEEAPDPAVLASQVEKATADLAQARVELAVHSLASKAGGNASALLDSRTFSAKLKGLDPDTDAEKITAAIKDAVKNNPAYRLTQGSSTGGGDIDPGKGEKQTGKAKSLNDAIAARLGK